MAKRLTALLLAVLILTALTGSEASGMKGMAEVHGLLTEVSEQYADTVLTVYDMKGDDSYTSVALVHYVLLSAIVSATGVDAAKSFDNPARSTLMMKELDRGYLDVVRTMEDKWEAYMNGELSGSEYVEFSRNVYKIFVKNGV